MGRRIGPKTWDRIREFFGDFWAVRDSPKTVVGCRMEFMQFYFGEYKTGNG